MTQLLKEIFEANQLYAKNFNQADLPIFPTRGLAILTCMDARIDPMKIMGLCEGDAHIIRNAGARASDDAIRSLVLSHKFLKTTHWFIIHHTQCGMETLNDAIIRQLFAESLEPATLGLQGWHNITTGQGSTEADYINWLTFNGNSEKSLSIDIARIKNHPLVPERISVYGFMYDIKTGKLREIS